MNCRRVNSLMSAYIDGELAGVEMLAIKRHLSACSACREEFESIRSVKRLMSTMAYVTPNGQLPAAICNRLDLCRIPGYQRIWNGFVHYGCTHISPAVAALAAVGAALVVMTAGSSGVYQEPTLASSTPAPNIIVRSVPDAGGMSRLEMAGKPQAPLVPVEESWLVPTSYPGFQLTGF